MANQSEIMIECTKFAEGIETNIKNESSLGEINVHPSGCDLQVHSTETCNRAQFWGAVGIFVEKPHILNRRLCGVSDIWWGRAQPDSGLLSMGTRTQHCVVPQQATTPVSQSTQNGLNHKTECKENSKGDDVNVKEQLMEQELTSNEESSGREKCLFKTKSDLVIQSKVLDKKLLNDNSKENYVAQEKRIENDLCEKLDSDTFVNIVNNNSCFEGTAVSSIDNIICQTEDLLDNRESNSCDTIENGNSDTDERNATSVSKQEDLVSRLKLRLGRAGFSSVTAEEGSRFEPWPALRGGQCDLFVVVRRAAPKQTYRFTTTIEVIFMDSSRDRCSVLSRVTKPPLLPCCTYHLQHNNQTISLTALPNNTHNAGMMSSSNTDSSANDHHRSNLFITSGLSWLRDTALPKLAKWATQVTEEGETSGGSSLAAVDLQAYSALYSSLKAKHASPLVERWQERTDPHKFVHEDIGIATYLLLLWSSLPKPQTFLDLGCGNGLLVYILTAEGHKGQGLDIKKRNIWNTFPSHVELVEREVRPCDGSLPRNVDWLLGNHSDELTPWIPVMAARSSYNCKFWVLPCCAHDFTTKFLRRNSGVSQYADYLNYVEEIGSVCGFQMQRDRLKIPSTKRVCFTGQSRTYSKEEWPQILVKIQEFIDKRVSVYQHNTPIKAYEIPTSMTQENAINSTDSMNSVANDKDVDGRRTSNEISIAKSNGSLNSMQPSNAAANKNELWSSGFVARVKDPRARNCTQLNPGVKEELVKAVVGIVLATSNPQEKCCWSSGCRTELRVVAQQLGSRQLRQLKQECGGLQTLLRNHRHIFIVENGTVKLRTPGEVGVEQKRHRQCWFESNHPQGCPNRADICIYDHGKLQI